MSRFVKDSAIRKYVGEKGRRTGKDFLTCLDGFIQDRLDAAVVAHDGTKKTIDAWIAGYVGLKPRIHRNAEKIG